MTTIALVAGSALSFRVKLKPSIPGSWMSIRISSGRKVSSSFSACSASTAVRASCPSAVSSKRASFRFAALSSTIRIGSLGMALLSVHLALDGLFEHPRQHGRERAALTDHAAHVHGARLRFDDALGHGQTEPSARIFLGGARIQLLELDEQAMQVFPPHANARVFYVDAEVRRAFRVHAHAHEPAVGRELDGIGQVIVQNLL